jgi:hypothetical protein
VFVSADQKRKAIDAAHKLNGDHGTEGKLRKVVELYWWAEMYLDIKDWVKTVEKYKKLAPLRYDKPRNVW